MALVGSSLFEFTIASAPHFLALQFTYKISSSGFAGIEFFQSKFQEKAVIPIC
jgi:hypothetical protein